MLFPDVLGPGRVPGPPPAVVRFVDRFTMSLPCTTRLSFDFFRSRVSISVNHMSEVRQTAQKGGATFTANIQVNDISNANIYHS